jgi:membrane associated rhomboid family serine protease
MYSSTNIADEIRESFRKGSTLTKLIYINLGVFVAVKVIYVFYFLLTANSLFDKSDFFQTEYLGYLMVPSDLLLLFHRPWTMVSYMFLHFGFLHILFNILVLYWFGRIFLHYLNQKQLLTTYLLGGFSGAAIFVLAYNIFPGLGNGQALGASAAIMAIVIAISFYVPNYEVYIPIIGPTRLKYIAIVYVVLDIIMIGSDNNAGGHFAHLGGAFYGYLFALQLKSGKDTGKWFTKLADNIASFFSRRSKMRVTHKSDARSMNDLDYNKAKVENQKEIDKILDKIAHSGYDSLTKKEKETLFKMSNKS